MSWDIHLRLLTFGTLLALNHRLLVRGNAWAPPEPHALNLLPADDYETLIDLRNFSFRAPGPDAARACGRAGGDAPLVLVLVHSATTYTHRRRAIRDTWGSLAAAPPGRPAQDARIRVLFVLGAVLRDAEQRALDRENELHGDLLQSSFLDTYRNLTYKYVTVLKWKLYHCPRARYLLKVDDDVFVNSPELLRFLARELPPEGARRLILCSPFIGSTVRRKNSKWSVTLKEYPSSIYPPYCSGWYTLYSPDVVFLIYREAQRTPYFWIDDVHMTGTVAGRANLSLTPTGPLSLSLTREQTEALIRAPLHSRPPHYPSHFLFSVGNRENDHLYKLWMIVKTRTLDRDKSYAVCNKRSTRALVSFFIQLFFILILFY